MMKKFLLKFEKALLKILNDKDENSIKLMNI